MVRNSPKVRVLAALAAGILLPGLAVASSATGDELRDRDTQVRGSIDTTLVDLDQSSAELAEAREKLALAQAELADAQTRLAETRGQLAAADSLDRQMWRRLVASVRRLGEAREDLSDGRANVTDQEDTLGQIAVQNYQSGDPSLLGLSMVLTSQNPSGLTGQLNSVQNMLDKESATLHRLEASRILLTVHRIEVRQGKRRVAAQREIAAANLRRKQSLESSAQLSANRVHDLTDLWLAAHSAAVQAREADLERLRALRQEQARISEMLRQQAEEARLLAAAAAAVAASPQRAVDLGSRPSNGFLDFPINTYITSPFGKRLHPVLNRWALHDGTDFGAGCGTPIRAAASGTVLATYFNTGYGNRVILEHGFRRGVGLGTAYNHLSSDSVAVGDRVKRGDIVGYVGTTGYSTGCHLHFMVFENGTAVNPMNLL